VLKIQYLSNVFGVFVFSCFVCILNHAYSVRNRASYKVWSGTQAENAHTFPKLSEQLSYATEFKVPGRIETHNCEGHWFHVKDLRHPPPETFEIELFTHKLRFKEIKSCVCSEQSTEEIVLEFELHKTNKNIFFYFCHIYLQCTYNKTSV
jgi:hypothetical protein